MESNLKTVTIEVEEPESVVLLGVGTGESHKDLLTAATPEFIDELEEIIGATDKLFIRQSQPAIPDALSSFDVSSVYEILNGKGERAFLLGKCRSKGSTMNFVILTSVGHGVMKFTKRGLFNHMCDIEGAGILKFTSVKTLSGYTLQDKWKKLLQLKTLWVELCACCLMSSSKSATMEFLNMDGTPSGTITYKKWISLGFEDRTICVHFIPNLDKKAKYMIFAASLIPFINYFDEPGRTQSSICIISIYVILLVAVILIILGLMQL